MRHQFIVGDLYAAIREFAREHGGVVFVSPMDCKLPDGNVLQPDVGYISPARQSIVEDHVMGAPDVVIEVLSKGTRRFDRDKKLAKYERDGVCEAWLVDPARLTVKVLTAEDGRWAGDTTVRFGDPIPSAILEIGAGGLDQYSGR